MKKEIDLMEYAGTILRALQKGVLLTTKSNGKVNSMTLGWGTLGCDWSKPIFVAYVRQSRFTAKQLQGNPEFTINVPIGGCNPEILGFCGSKSGFDTDKIKELGLTLEEPEAVSVPGIKELPLTLECRVVCVDKQDIRTMPQEIIDKDYPETPTRFGGSRDNFHYAFYGEILRAYVIE